MRVKWHAKGGIFTKPTLLGGMNGVGEAGPEAVLPLKRSVLQEIGDRILSSTSVSSRAQTIQPVNNYEFNFTIDGNADEVTMKQTTQQIIDSITKFKMIMLRHGVKQESISPVFLVLKRM